MLWIIVDSADLVYLSHLHLNVCSASIAAFRISLAISPHFVWISSKSFSFFNVSHKHLSFIIWNFIEYLHTQDFQRAATHRNVGAKILLFCFVYGCKTTHKKFLKESKRRKLVFTLHSPPHIKPYKYFFSFIFFLFILNP